MASYVENFKSKVDFPKPFQRTGKFPIDRTDLFDSYADAVKYAAGNRSDPDSRGLCGTSYIGQIITVYEDDVVTVYKIDADRTLKEIGAAPDFQTGYMPSTLIAGTTSVDINIPEGSNFVDAVVKDSTGEQVLTDVLCKDNLVTISVSEALSFDLSIIVTYYR